MNRTGISSSVNSQADLRLPFAVLALALAAWGLYTILVTGPAMRAVAQANLERTLADENRAFCEKFGLRVGSGEFVACSQELMYIRKKQADRDGEAGML